LLVESAVQKTEKGNKVLKHSLGKVQYEQKTEETYIEFLYRLLALQKERFRKIATESLGGLEGFTKPIQNTIASTYTAGEALRSTWANLSQIKPNYAIGHVTIPKISPLPKLGPPRSEALLEDVSERLELLIEQSKITSEYSISATNTQLKIANALQSAVVEGRKSSRINIILSILIIVLTALSITMGVISIGLADRLGSEQTELQGRGLTVIEEYLEAIRDIEAEQSEIHRSGDEETQEALEAILRAIYSSGPNHKPNTAMPDSANVKSGK